MSTSFMNRPVSEFGKHKEEFIFAKGMFDKYFIQLKARAEEFRLTQNENILEDIKLLIHICNTLQEFYIQNYKKFNLPNMERINLLESI